MIWLTVVIVVVVAVVFVVLVLVFCHRHDRVYSRLQTVLLFLLFAFVATAEQELGRHCRVLACKPASSRGLVWLCKCHPAAADSTQTIDCGVASKQQEVEQ